MEPQCKLDFSRECCQRAPFVQLFKALVQMPRRMIPAVRLAVSNEELVHQACGRMRYAQPIPHTLPSFSGRHPVRRLARREKAAVYPLSWNSLRQSRGETMRLKHLAFGPLSGTLWIAVLSASVAIDVGAQPAWRPEKPVEMIITTAPGGTSSLRLLFERALLFPHGERTDDPLIYGFQLAPVLGVRLAIDRESSAVGDRMDPPGRVARTDV